MVIVITIDMCNFLPAFGSSFLPGHCLLPRQEYLTLFSWEWKRSICSVGALYLAETLLPLESSLSVITEIKMRSSIVRGCFPGFLWDEFVTVFCSSPQMIAT